MKSSVDRVTRQVKTGGIGFGTGFYAFFRGLTFIRKEGLWLYVLLPALLGLVTWIALIYTFIRFSGSILIEYTTHFTGVESTTLDVFLWLIAIGAGGLFAFISYRFIVGILVIPFLGPFLSRMEKILTGSEVQVTPGRDLKNIWYGIIVAVQFAFFGFFIWVFSLFLGPLQILVIALAESYFLGREAMDPIYEKETGNLRERRKLAHKNFPALMGLGFAFFLFLWIPGVGVLLAPAAAIAGGALLRYKDGLHHQ